MNSDRLMKPAKTFSNKNKQAGAAVLYTCTALLLAVMTTFNSATWAQTPPIEPSLPYTVKASDKLIRLSRDMLVSPQAWADVAKYNQLKNPDVIAVGQKIDIPLRFLKSKAASGKVISTEGDVSSSGSALQPGTAIVDGSQLKTGANSSAVIELGDGSRIKILPNSLAQVVSNRDYVLRDASASGSTNWFSGLMRLSAGTLEALAAKNTKRATPLQIETPTSVVGVRGTSFRVAYDDPASKSARTEVIEGQVRADNPAQGNGADLPMGTGAVVKPLEKDIKVVTLLPAPDLAGLPTDILKPQGSWPMPNLVGATGYRVQVSSDDKFDKILRDLKVTTPSADLADLPKGNWYARVRGIDAVGLEGFDSIKLIAVKDGEWRVSYSSISLAGGKALLSWTSVQSSGQAVVSSSYTAVLAQDAALAKTLTTSPSLDGKQQLDLGDLNPGTYYLRLASSDGSRSEIYQFNLPANWGKSVFNIMSALHVIK